MNEYSININQLVKTIIFEDNAQTNEISYESLVKKLANFMDYSAPEEIEDLATIFWDDQDTVKRKNLQNNITKDLNFKEFDENTGIPLFDNYF